METPEHDSTPIFGYSRKQLIDEIAKVIKEANAETIELLDKKKIKRLCD